MAEPCQFGDGIGIVDGKISPIIWPTTCERYPVGANLNGLTLRDVGGVKKLYVTPDAGTFVERQVKGIAVTGPLDGPNITSYNLSAGNTGVALVNTRNGGGTPLSSTLSGVVGGRTNCGATVLRNTSCARNWRVNVNDYVHFMVSIGAGANATFILKTSTDYTNWTVRVSASTDNRGVSQTRNLRVFLNTNTLYDLAPSQVILHDLIVELHISGGSATLSEFQIYSESNVNVNY
jgi:hypothetical protein